MNRYREGYVPADWQGYRLMQMCAYLLECWLIIGSWEVAYEQ